MPNALAQYGNIFVGRQPILDINLKTVGYDVLYRNCDIDAASFPGDGIATARILLNTYLEIVLEHVVGAHLAFLTIPKSFVLEKYCDALPKDRVVLELAETIDPHPRVVEALTSLSRHGYTIALKNFVYHDRFRPLLELADMVKINVMGLSRAHIQQEVRRLRNYRVRLLAEKVESRETYELCKQEGFFYFQGLFFYRPDMVDDQEIPANRVALLELMGNIQDPSISLKRLVGYIRNDLALSYKILRYVNSAFVGLPRRVDGIEQAASLVGIDRIRTWATLILMASGKDQPMEMLVMALVRAKMCERLGQCLGADTPEKYFTMGMLSILDILYGSSIETISANLPLSDDILKALTSGEGTMGAVLQGVKAYEEGEWLKLKHLRLQPAIIRDMYLESIEYANHFSPLMLQPQ